MTAQELIERFPAQKRDAVRYIVRLLLETSQISYDDSKFLHLNKGLNDH